MYDFKCDNCNHVQEFRFQPDDVCEVCGSGNWRRLFSTPQLITKHASTIDYVIKRNKYKMAQVYEEDSSASNIKSMYQDV
jgi:putative FmdB family regulatory protein